MNPWNAIGLRWRLGLALAAVATVSVALATVLAGRGLDSRLDQFAEDRLQAAAIHSADLAANLYVTPGRWTASEAARLTHLAEMNGYRIAITDSKGRPVGTPASIPNPRAEAPVLVDGRPVGTVAVAPVEGQVLTGEDRALRERLNNLHMIAGALALALGLLTAAMLAPALARPLRRLTAAASRIQSGDLQTRVEPAGAPEMRALASAFNNLAETLEQEERVRRDASADVAHELRTPLAAIVSRIEAARDGILTDEHSNLGAMHTEALRLSRLVEDLGKLAEAQQPGLTLHKQPLDLRDLVVQRASIYRDYFEAKDVAFEKRIGPAVAHGDRGRIIQIVDNLLSNALRYTDAGGTVTIELSQHGGEAVLEVADTGIGIRDEDRPYIFERFWRGEPSRARRTGGAGIGLAIVRELVHAHGGGIDVQSKVGEGSLFRVTLPAEPSSR